MDNQEDDMKYWENIDPKWLVEPDLDDISIVNTNGEFLAYASGKKIASAKTLEEILEQTKDSGKNVYLLKTEGFYELIRKANLKNIIKISNRE